MKLLVLALILVSCQSAPKTPYNQLVAEATAQEWLKNRLPWWYRQVEPITCISYCQNGLLNSDFMTVVEDLRVETRPRNRIVIRCDSAWNCHYYVKAHVP